MKFYVFRTCNTDPNEPPVTCVPLTKECAEGFGVPDWIMDADSFEDAFDKLMPESPFKEFMVYKMPNDEKIKWAIEVYDQNNNRKGVKHEQVYGAI